MRSLQEAGVTIWDEWAERRRRARSGLRLPVAQLAGARRPPHRPDGECGRRDPAQSRFAPADRLGVERRRHSADEAAAVPRVLPVLRGRRDGCPASSTSAAATSSSGVPFNIASYALLTHMVAQQCDLDVGDFVWTGGDCHLYLNHLEQVETQLARAPYPLPRLVIHRRPDSLFDYRVRGLRDRRLPVPSGDQGAGGRLTACAASRPGAQKKARREEVSGQGGSNCPRQSGFPGDRRRDATDASAIAGSRAQNTLRAA